MKNTLLHLSLYLLYATLCAIVILLVLLAMGAPLWSLSPVVGPVIFFAWIVGLVPATQRLLRTGRRPVITAAVVALFTSGVLVVAILLSGTGDGVSSESRLVRAMSEGTVETDRIYQGREYSVLIDRMTGSELGPVVVADHTEKVDAQLTEYAVGYWDRLGGELILPDGPDIDLTTLKGFGVPVMPSAVRSTVTDFLQLVETATLLWSSPIPFVDSDRLPVVLRSIVSPILVVLMFTLLLTAVWTPLRLTRWPLLNVVAGLAYLRAVISLPAAADRLMRVEIIARWISPLSRAELVLMVGAVIFLSLAVIAAILPSLATWRHHMHFQEDGA